MLAKLGKKLPAHKGPDLLWRGLALAIIVIGVTIGIFSAVRTCSILVSIGALLFTYISYTRSESRRTIELLVPIGLSLLLFFVSLTLPHAK